jgi:hypothetical protein
MKNSDFPAWSKVLCYFFSESSVPSPVFLCVNKSNTEFHRAVTEKHGEEIYSLNHMN